jgi:ferredoxin-like protein FixX
VSELKPITVNVAGYLALNKYEVDEGNPHIKLVLDPAPAEFGKLVRVCPAALYQVDQSGAQTFDYAGCLECGTCRIVAGDTIIQSWNYPGPTMGVEYRYG